MLDDLNDLKGNYGSPFLQLEDLQLLIESKKEGAFEIELKSIDIIFDPDIDKRFAKYKHGIFVKL
jgi:hypothetical protein